MILRVLSRTWELFFFWILREGCIYNMIRWCLVVCSSNLVNASEQNFWLCVLSLADLQLECCKNTQMLESLKSYVVKRKNQDSKLGVLFP